MKDKIEQYKKLKSEILALAVSSSNPDNYTDLENALNRIQAGMEASYEK